MYYLRCLTKQKEWIRWFPWADCYNTSYDTFIHTTPFILVYGWDPPQLRTYSSGDAKIQAVHDLLTERDSFLEQTKLHLHQSQDYTEHYNTKHVDRNFTVGEWVWLKLMARSAVAISTLQKGKCYLWNILDPIIQMALCLPPWAPFRYSHPQRLSCKST